MRLVKPIQKQKIKAQYFKESEIVVVVKELPTTDDGYKSCDRDPVTHDCPNCIYVALCDSEHNITLTTNIPKRIVDFYWPILHQHEKDILIFLANRANFAKDSNQHGVAFATKKQISKGTKVPVSNMHKYILPLARRGLIAKHTSNPKYDNPSNSWYKTVQYVVTWFKKMEDIKNMVAKINHEARKKK